jgi:hypothetical protein
MGKLENRSSTSKFSRLVARIETVRQDPRYAFMFDNANVGGDTMAEVVGQLFRLPANGKPMTVMQLAGFPSEVVDPVASVLGRMAFDFGLWSDGAVPLLFVCEEAHRYAPGDKSIGFGPTREAISRSAKEGRKYGVFLGMVTQRLAELDATIISQCNTLFVMRMANERDQNVIRSAVSDAAASLLAFLPSLGTREFAFGEGVALPTRLRFSELPQHMDPAQRVEAQRRFQPRGRQRIHPFRRGTLARGDDGQQAHDRRNRRRARQAGSGMGRIRDRGRVATAGGGDAVDQCPIRRARKPPAQIAARAGDPPRLKTGASATRRAGRPRGERPGQPANPSAAMG